jgi:hypothetical protein
VAGNVECTRDYYRRAHVSTKLLKNEPQVRAAMRSRTYRRNLGQCLALCLQDGGPQHKGCIFFCTQHACMRAYILQNTFICTHIHSAHNVYYVWIYTYMHACSCLHTVKMKVHGTLWTIVCTQYHQGVSLTLIPQYVCQCVWMNVCLHIWMYTRVCVCARACVCCACVCVCVCIDK